MFNVSRKTKEHGSVRISRRTVAIRNLACRQAGTQYAILLLLLVSCGKDDPDNTYSMLSRHWVETGREVDGKEEQATQLQHVFYQTGSQGNLYYEFVCGVPCSDGAAGQTYHGSWQPLSDSTVSTNIDGAIRSYIIRKLTPAELWLQEKGTPVLSKLERYR